MIDIGADMTDIKIVCGLGNPGERYEHTRHNLGYDVVDGLANEAGLPPAEEAGLFSYRAAKTACLIKPLTFVNRSGKAVRAALDGFDAGPDELFVINDDFHLPLGEIRIRKSGSSGGHNGLQSIIDEIGTIFFPRIRIGIGPLPEAAAGNAGLISEFVLSRFEPEEEKIVATAISRAVEAVGFVINGDIDLAISKYNSFDPTPGA